MTATKSYSQLQQELQVILSRFDHAEHTDVDELIADYEKGMQCIKQIEKYLNSAEIKLKKIVHD